MAFTPFQDNYWYIGWAKQSVQGTPVAPTKFWRWRDGTMAGPRRKVTTEYEGDASPFENLPYSEGQHYEIMVKEYARPITMGCALEAIHCTGGETYTAPTKNTTLSASVTAGATTCSVAADLGNVGTLAVNVSGTYASAVYEVVTLDLTTRSGAGPFVYTVAASGTFKKAHSNSDPVNSVSTHLFTRATAGYDFYTIEYGYTMPGASPKSFRIQDCVCYGLKISGQAGKPLMLEHSWYGITSSTPASQASPTYEGYNLSGVTGGPLMYYQNNGTLQIDGAATGQGASITQFDLSLKNSTAADLQNELFLLSGFLPGTISYDLALQAHFQNYNQFAETYLGSTTLSTSSTDNFLTGIGAFAGTFSTDTINALAISVPNMAYIAADLSAPKPSSGKAVTQAITAKPLKQGATVPVSLTLTNSQNAAY
jgi:hypothetical protein